MGGLHHNWPIYRNAQKCQQYRRAKQQAKEAEARGRDLVTDAAAQGRCLRNCSPSDVVPCRTCAQALSCLDDLDYAAAQDEVRGWRDRGYVWNDGRGVNLTADKALFSVYSSNVTVDNDKVAIGRSPNGAGIPEDEAARIVRGREVAAGLMRAALRRIVLYRRTH